MVNTPDYIKLIRERRDNKNAVIILTSMLQFMARDSGNSRVVLAIEKFDRHGSVDQLLEDLSDTLN